MSHRALGKQFSWADIAQQHPDYAKDEGIHGAATMLAGEDQDSPETLEHDPVYQKASVPLDSVVGRGFGISHSNPRFKSAVEGYKGNADVPPVVLTSVGNEHHIADGHHRVAAARSIGMTHIPAYVMRKGQ
jgi:hypothetical protein